MGNSDPQILDFWVLEYFSQLLSLINVSIFVQEDCAKMDNPEREKKLLDVLKSAQAKAFSKLMDTESFDIFLRIQSGYGSYSKNVENIYNFGLKFHHKIIPSKLII